MAVLTRPTITPSEASLGAVVTDVDLRNLDDTTWETLHAAFHQYGVLIFPAQHLTSDAQTAFGRMFGSIEELVPGQTAISLSNQKPGGGLLGDGEGAMKYLVGNEGWHTDSSYMPVSAKASILSAQVTPSHGGQTEWADMRAAYDALDTDMRERVTRLSACHSLLHSQAKLGHEAADEAGYGVGGGPPPLRPLVKIHPVTGRRSLFIGRHAYGVSGLGPEDSEKLLEELLAFACQPPRIYRHEWAPGDVAVWDNRCLLHRARPYDHGELRAMLHVRVSGDPRTELAANARTAVQRRSAHRPTARSRSPALSPPGPASPCPGRGRR